MSAERLSATIVGRVQGVGFRYWTLRHARRLGVRGWVRNGHDGRSVEVVAEGEPTQIDELEALLRRGPPGSFVERHAFRRDPSTGEFEDFTIVRSA